MSAWVFASVAVTTALTSAASASATGTSDHEVDRARDADGRWRRPASAAAHVGAVMPTVAYDLDAAVRRRASTVDTAPR